MGLTLAQLSTPNTTAQAAAANNIPASFLSSIIGAESGGDPNAVSKTGVQGLAQITQATWGTYFPGVPYSTDPQQQLNAGAYILGNLYKQYGGNTALTATAYNGGPGVANLAQSYVANGTPVMTAIQEANANYVDKAGNSISAAKQSETYNYALKVSGATASGAGQVINITEGVNDNNPPPAVPVEGSSQAITQSNLAPSLVITESLDETAWFDDPAILQVDGATRGVPTPVSFAIYYDLNGAPMSGPKGPITIKLNASLQTIERSMRHVLNRQTTRTGYLLTMWGMQPDTITGSGNTGVFMNQLGLTDFFSVSNIDGQVQNFIKQGWVHAQVTSTDPNKSTFMNVPADWGGTSKELTTDSLRVAAKDAFAEFLFTFKNNGIVWFQNPNSTAKSTQEIQLGPNAWSPQTGSSVLQNQGRRNDVMTRGGIAMFYRNSVYYGYFKSLNWTEDAEKPFSWNFTFVFQVERTVTCVNMPDLSQ